MNLPKYSPEELASYRDEVRKHNELLTPKKIILCNSCQDQGLYYVPSEEGYQWCESCNPYHIDLRGVRD